MRPYTTAHVHSSGSFSVRCRGGALYPPDVIHQILTPPPIPWGRVAVRVRGRNAEVWL
jgi:hypothetical protein